MNAPLSIANPPAVIRHIAPLIDSLRQLRELVSSVTKEQYSLKPVGVVSSSLGGHVRHTLDHIDTLLRGLIDGTVDYDHRARGTDIENDRDAAHDEIVRLIYRLEHLGRIQIDAPMIVRALTDTHLPPVELKSTLGREIAFVVSHTIHHQALIGIIAKLLTVPVSDRFGFAISTLAYRERRSCVR